MVSEEISEVIKPDLDFVGADTTYLTHNFHSYPAKFIPQLARWVIEKFSSERQTILDPMCGCGTSLIEARLVRKHSFGVDIDPLACLLTKVKSTPIKVDLLNNAISKMLERIHVDFRRLEKQPGLSEYMTDYVEETLQYTIPNFYRRDELFRQDVLIELAIIKNRIKEIQYQEIRDFCLVAFSSIIKAVSNCDPKDIEPKLPPPERRKVKKPETLSIFETKIRLMQEKMNEFSRICPSDVFAEVYCADARSLPADINGVDLILTSPPYANSVDYPRIHKLSFYWLDMATSENLRELSKNYVGTELVTKETYDNIKKSGLDLLDDPLEKIAKVDKKRAGIVYKYFIDMQKCLDEMNRVLRTRGKCCVVIGDSKIRGHLIPTHDIFKILAGEAGFKLKHEFGRTIDLRKKQTANAPNEYGGGAINTEYVLVFEK